MAFSHYSDAEQITHIQSAFSLMRHLDPEFVSGHDLPEINGKMDAQAQNFIEAYLKHVEINDLEGALIDPKNLKQVWHAIRTDIMSDLKRWPTYDVSHPGERDRNIEIKLQYDTQNPSSWARSIAASVIGDLPMDETTRHQFDAVKAFYGFQDNMAFAGELTKNILAPDGLMRSTPLTPAQAEMLEEGRRFLSQFGITRVVPENEVGTQVELYSMKASMSAYGLELAEFAKDIIDNPASANAVDIRMLQGGLSLLDHKNYLPVFVGLTPIPNADGDTFETVIDGELGMKGVSDSVLSVTSDTLRKANAFVQLTNDPLFRHGAMHEKYAYIFDESQPNSLNVLNDYKNIKFPSMFQDPESKSLQKEFTRKHAGYDVDSGQRVPDVNEVDLGEVGFNPGMKY